VPTAPGSPEREIDREVVRLAVPALGALLAPPLFLLADAAIVGRLGAAPLAGLGLAGIVVTTVTNLSIFLAYGTTGSVARLLGAGRRAAAVRHGVSALWLGAAIGVVAAVAGLLVTDPVLAAFAAPAEATEQAAAYLRIAWLGLPALLVSLAATGVLRGLQNTRTPLLVAGCGAATNVVLNVVLVLALDLGIEGAALGTVVTEVAMAVWLAAVVAADAGRHRVGWTPHLVDVVSSWRTGWPLLLRTVMLRVALLAATAAAARLGTQALAAHNVAYVVWGLLALALDALAIAAQALVGKYLGGGDPRAVRVLTTRLVRWGLLAGTALGLLTAAAAVPLAPLFTDDLEVRRLLVVALLVVAALQPLAGWVFVLDGILIGAGDGRYLAVAGLVSTAAFLPLVALAVEVGDSRGPAAGIVALWLAMGGWVAARAATLAPRARSARWLVLGAAA
jgi:putative MATE family efflux protein